MFSFKQCELARTMTKDTASDTQINKEYSLMNESTKISVINLIESMLPSHRVPFDKDFENFVKDFSRIATEFSVSPATVFCVYMENKK